MRLFLLALVLLCACDDIQKVDRFSVGVTTSVNLAAATPAEAALTTLPELPGLTALDLSESDAFESRGHAAEDVDRLVLAEATLTATAPPGRDLSFFGEVRLYVEAEGQPRKLLGRVAGLTPGPNRVEFERTQDDLTAWLVGTSGRITLEAIRSQRPPQQTTIELRLLFEVEVKVL